jgi:hypothetical protein
MRDWEPAEKQYLLRTPSFRGALRQWACEHPETITEANRNFLHGIQPYCARAHLYASCRLLLEAILNYAPEEPGGERTEIFRCLERLGCAEIHALEIGDECQPKDKFDPELDKNLQILLDLAK